jgi:Xaa-Pro aminopeptidase
LVVDQVDYGGLVRIEDDVLVASDGCEVLIHLPKTSDCVRL